MINILSVDDQPMNHEVIKLDIEEYMANNGIIEYEIHTAKDGFEAIKMVKKYKPRIVFMDMMMPILTGTETIKCIRVLDDNVKDTVIIVVTALNDHDSRAKAKEAGANGFISKPFNESSIHAMFHKYIDEIQRDQDESLDDDFFDFDDDMFEDDNGDDQTHVYNETMNSFNLSHKKVPANVFLQEYEEMEIENILEDIQELDAFIEDHIDILYEDNLEDEVEHINQTLEKYSVFLNSFNEFYELSTSLNLLIRQLKSTDFGTLSSRERNFIAEYIKSILKDLSEWKKNVFITREAIDVFYINASLLSSCIQLENFIKSKIKQI